MLRFNDGVGVDTSGPRRVTHLRDGYYIAGQDMLIFAGDTREDAEGELAHWRNVDAERIRRKVVTSEEVLA